MSRFYRGAFYLLGTVLLVFGITLNTKTGLGVSPMISVTFSMSEIWSLNFGLVNFVFYLVLIGAQMALYGKVAVIYFLQLPLSAVFNTLLGSLGSVIAYNGADHSLAVNLCVLLAAILITGFGICLMVNMRLVPTPGDGIIYALAYRLKWELGFTKNVSDVICVAVTCAIGLLFAGKIVGIGLGTVAGMIGTGRAVALVNWLFKDKMMRLAGVTE